MTTTSPDADVRLPDVFDFEGVPRAPRRHCDIVAIPAMEIGLGGIAQLRRALDEGEAGILSYRFRTVDRSGIDMAKARDRLLFLGFEGHLDEIDWTAVGRLGETGELGRLHALLAADETPENGADLPEACAYHGGEGDGGEFCDGCREDQGAIDGEGSDLD